jgi:hypothetical protein
VREAALLALCRYMAVSHALCEQVLPRRTALRYPCPPPCVGQSTRQNPSSPPTHPPTRPSNIVLPLVLVVTILSPIPLAPQYLPLLFTALEREACPANRTSVVIALGDLAFRFPNALEPW